MIESCCGFSLQAVKLQQFFGQSTKGTETERELGGRKSRRSRAEEEAEEEADAEAEAEEAEKKNKNKKPKKYLGWYM